MRGAGERGRPLRRIATHSTDADGDRGGHQHGGQPGSDPEPAPRRRVRRRRGVAGGLALMLPQDGSRPPGGVERAAALRCRVGRRKPVLSAPDEPGPRNAATAVGARRPAECATGISGLAPARWVRAAAG